MSLFDPLRRRSATRRALKELSQLDARLLRDIGIDPADVHDAFMGNRLSVLLNPIRRKTDSE